LHRYKTLDTECTKGTVVTSGRDDDWSVDCVGIHAGLIIVVHGNECPVGNHACNTESTVVVLAGDKVFNGGGIEELDVWECEDFGEESGCEKSL
jgi:hypothetical protein